MEIEPSESRERELSSPGAQLGANIDEEAVGGEEDASSIEVKPFELLKSETQSSVQAVPGGEIEDKASRDPSNNTAVPQELAREQQPRSFFEELRFLPMKTTSHYAGDFEPSRWLVALTFLMVLAIVYLAVDIASLCLRKLKRSIKIKGDLRCVGSMGWSFVRGGERSVLKADTGSFECGDSSGGGDTSKNYATIPSESEVRRAEGVHASAEPIGIPSDAAKPPRASLPALQQASSSIRRARAWSSPCLNPGLHFQSNFQSNNRLTPRPSQNTVRSSIYRALSCDDDSDGSVSRHPSFTRAAMAVMMTRPCSVLQAKRVVAAAAIAQVNAPTPLLSSLVETEGTVRRSHQLVAALRFQHIWRSRSGAATDESEANVGADGDGQQRLTASRPGELLTAMESIPEIIEGDVMTSNAETARLQPPFARFPPSLPKY